MCGVIFGMDCARKTTKNLNWTIPLPERPNAALDRRTDDSIEEEIIETEAAEELETTKEEKSSSSKSMSSKAYTKVVQVTDLHVDPYYTAGANADCGEPLCCRNSNGMTPSPEKTAGVWGDYRNCDTPIATLRHALKHISDAHSNVKKSDLCHVEHRTLQ